MRLEQFGFRALWSPYFLLFTIVVIVLFFFIAKYKRHHFEGSAPLSIKHKILFPFTMMLIYIIKGSPIDLMGHLMFTFHMVQMALLYLLTPQLLIISIPDWMWKKIINLPIIKPLYTLFTKPIIALVLFNGVFSFYHIPFVFDIVKTNIWYHALYTILLFVLALNMWWPLLNNVEGEKKIPGVGKLGYLLAASVLLTPACALIIFNKNPMFETYTNPELWMQSLLLCVPADMLQQLNLSNPAIFNLLPYNYDQQLGGVIMKVLQEVFYGGILYRIFIEWYQKDQNEPDPIIDWDTNLTNK